MASILTLARSAFLLIQGVDATVFGSLSERVNENGLSRPGDPRPRGRVPLREQTFRLPPVYIAAAVFIVLLVLLLPVFERAHIPPVLLLLIGALFLIVLFGTTAIGLSIGRRIVGDHVEVAIRAPGERWRHGPLAVRPGHSLSRRTQFNFTSHPGTQSSLTKTNSVKTRPGARAYVRFGSSILSSHIVQAKTDLGIRELAALPSTLEELRERLNENGPTTAQRATLQQ